MSARRQGRRSGFSWGLCCTTLWLMQLASASPVLNSTAAPVSAEVLALRQENALLKQQVERLMHELLPLTTRAEEIEHGEVLRRVAEIISDNRLQHVVDEVLHIDAPRLLAGRHYIYGVAGWFLTENRFGHYRISPQAS